MILYKLYTGIEIGSVELVWNIPSQRPELSALLYACMQERHRVQHRFPLRHIGHLEEVLAYGSVRTLQPGLDTLWRLIRKLDRNLSIDYKNMLYIVSYHIIL